MTNPSVTIPITSYNQEIFIEKSVLSAVEQDYDNLQVVVYDDTSTDNSPKILKELERKYVGRLRVIFNQNQLKGAKNRTYSLVRADTKYVTYLDGDDYFLPGKISKQVDYMETNPEIALSYHNTDVFETGTDEHLFFWNERFGSGNTDLRNLIRYGNFLPAVSVMFRRSALGDYQHRDSVDMGQDWMIFLYIALNSNGQIGYLDEVLAKYRRHPENWTLNWEEKFSGQIHALQEVKKLTNTFIRETRLRTADIHLIRFLNQFSRMKWSPAFSSLFSSLRYAFPELWLLGRLPLREIKFALRTRRMDDLIASLFRG